MTVVIEYVTALLEYLGFRYKACIGPEVAGLFPLLILSIFTINFNIIS